MHINAALAPGQQNLCIFTQLSLPGSRIYAYLHSSRFRVTESMHIYAALASGEQNLCIFTQLSLHRCNGGLHQERAGRLNATGGCIRHGRGRLCLHRAGSVQTEKIAFASSRLGANGKDCVCIESARCKQKRLRLHRAGCICIEHNQLTCQPVGQTTTTRATRKLLEMLVFTRVSGFTV